IEEPADAQIDGEYCADGFGGVRYTVDPVAGDLWVDRDGQRTRLYSGLNEPSAIAVSPNGLWLAVAERRASSGLSYRIRADGSLDAAHRFYVFLAGDGAHPTGAGG